MCVLLVALPSQCMLLQIVSSGCVPQTVHCIASPTNVNTHLKTVSWNRELYTVTPVALTGALNLLTG